MRPSKGFLFAALVVTGLLLQLTGLARLGLPGTQPGLLLVVVVACALAAGPLAGAVLGFCAGLLADVVPPVDHTLGLDALVLCLVGYTAGMLEDVEERSVFAPMALVAAEAIGAGLLLALIGGLIGNHRLSPHLLIRGLPFAVLYDVVLTPFVVPLVAVLVRRIEPDTSLR